jgi:hypothetical protein
MPEISPRFAKRHVVAGTIAPVAVAPPINCNYVRLRNGGAVPVRVITDLANPDAFEEIAPGDSDLIDAPKFDDSHRFSAGNTIFWVLGVGAATDVYLTFVY